MIEIRRGSVMSRDGSKKADIIVKAAAPNDLKQILIGGGTVLVDIIYLTAAAFKRGAKAYESAELNALADIGAMDKQDVKEILEGDKYFTK
jgi:hypothetical protein